MPWHWRNGIFSICCLSWRSLGYTVRNRLKRVPATPPPHPCCQCCHNGCHQKRSWFSSILEGMFLSAAPIKGHVYLSTPESGLRWSICIFKHCLSMPALDWSYWELFIPCITLKSIFQNRLIPWRKKPYEGMLRATSCPGDPMKLWSFFPFLNG